MVIISVFSSFPGGLTIGVPGEVKGLYYAYRKFGRLPWKHLVEPSIYLAKNGFHMSARLSAITRIKKNSLQEDIGLRYRNLSTLVFLDLIYEFYYYILNVNEFSGIGTTKPRLSISPLSLAGAPCQKKNMIKYSS